MKKKTGIKITIFLLGLLFAIGGGILVLEKGLPLLIEADNLINNFTCDDGLDCISKNVHHPITLNGEMVGKLSGRFSFVTPYVFSPFDTVKYEFDITVPRPELIEKMYFLLLLPHDDFEEIKTLSDSKIIEKYYNNGLIILNKQNEKFVNDINDGVWRNGNLGTIRIIPIIINEDTPYFLGTPEVLFTLEDRDIRNLAINQHDEKIGNKQILALTWLGLAMAPILLGIDMMIRVVLKE